MASEQSYVILDVLHLDGGIFFENHCLSDPLANILSNISS